MLAFGLTVFGVVSAVVIIWLGKTAIVIDAKDPGIEVAVKGQQAVITVPGKQSIKVEPGEQELTVNYAGMETKTTRFALNKGQTKTLVVAVVDSKLIAHLDNETLELRTEDGKIKAGGKAGGAVRARAAARELGPENRQGGCE